MNTLANSLILPELKLVKFYYHHRSHNFYACEKTSAFEVCPKCGVPSSVVYDHRMVTIRDSPVRDRMIYLKIKKRRFFCKPCKKPFTEPVPGVVKGQRTTQRLKRAVTWACENFIDLERVRKTFHVSSGFVFKLYYEQLELKRRMRLYPWPSTIGIDEHSFRRNKRLGITEFATVIVDYPNKRVMELVEGKTGAALSDQLSHIEGRENVKNVIVDLCDPFKQFAKEWLHRFYRIRSTKHADRILTKITDTLAFSKIP